jgi:hypothetical protein
MIPTQIPNGKQFETLSEFILICKLIYACRNDILRARGILPPKDEKTEEEINDLIDEVIAERIAKENSLDDKTLDELDELEDDEDDRILLEYRYGGFIIWHA